MPKDDITPFDSYARRLKGETKDAAKKKGKADAERAAEPPTPFDSYTGRLNAEVERAGIAGPEEAEAGVPETQRELEPVPTASPAGTGDYVVKQGECTASIAVDSGHFWENIWNDPANAELRQARVDPNVLLPGDRLTIQPLRPKKEPGQTEMRHRFVRRGEPASLRVRLTFCGKPRGNLPYVLTLDGGIERTGTTDVNGNLQVPLPAKAHKGVLKLGGGDEQQVYHLDLGQINPQDDITGIQQRLSNMGYPCGSIDGILGPHTRAALCAFQEAFRLPATGEPDAATQARLKQEHGN